MQFFASHSECWSKARLLHLQQCKQIITDENRMKTTNNKISQANYRHLKIATNRETPLLPFDFSTHCMLIQLIASKPLHRMHCDTLSKKTNNNLIRSWHRLETNAFIVTKSIIFQSKCTSKRWNRMKIRSYACFYAHRWWNPKKQFPCKIHDSACADYVDCFEY